ncbi:Zinc ABC transporter, substrate-binding protein ZnuA [hydrothermal vent metagenome]|uniref:Zinc ABC transporter, substrate-binding protein ZnuA n=1 Tax=hydrothermal vent metagenome TaxID=652676 RepID=A0A3B0TEN2_9ZZZZ
MKCNNITYLSCKSRLVKILPALLGALGGIFISAGLAQAGPKVVASIKPLHSLVAAVMEGVGEAALIVDGAASPHNFSLKPSKARKIESAEVIFWFGPRLEAFLQKPIKTLGAGARVVVLSEALDGAESHPWLDPHLAKAMVAKIEPALAGADPANALAYAANAQALAERLDALRHEVAEILSPVRTKPFLVFHDAYRAFTRAFGLNAVGAITTGHHVRPGAARIAKIRARIKELGRVCIFSEPQFKPNLVAVIVEGTAARTGVLDPLGAALKPGPDLYFTLIRNLARSIENCLT